MGSADIPQWQPHLPPNSIYLRSTIQFMRPNFASPRLKLLCYPPQHLIASQQSTIPAAVKGAAGSALQTQPMEEMGTPAVLPVNPPLRENLPSSKQILASPGKKNETQQLRRAAEIAQLYNCLEKCQPNSLSTKECTWPSL